MARQYTLERYAGTGAAGRIDFAAELNPQQCAAVTAAPGPALVIAGAGSGKTRTLTYRVAYLIENGIAPANILLLTFTNKAAREMLNRVANLLPNDITGLWGGTFHSVGNRILRRHAEQAGFAPGFSIMDREDQQDLIDSVIGTLGFDPKERRFPKGELLADLFSFSINTTRPIAEILAERYPHFLELTCEIAAAQEKYEAKKRAANCLDFDDLLEKTVRLLQRQTEIRERYQRQFQFILVDEYQDTNRIQADFIDMLGARHQNIMVVGDDAQSIYSWRGADFKNILEFPRRYPRTQVHRIEINYRSVPEILEVANAAIAANIHQFKKELVSARKAAPQKPALVQLDDSNRQAAFVAQRILELHNEGIDLSEIAVLYRAHFHSMELQMELTRRGIPFEITSGLRFFEQAHIKDVAAFLKFVVNPRDEIAFKRMVRLLPGVGARTAELLWNEVSVRLEKAVAPETAQPESVPAGAASTEVSVGFRQLLGGMKVPGKTSKAWDQLIHTLEEMAPGGVHGLPAEMIKIVVEAIYNDYARVEFTNYEQRRDDLSSLASFARQFKSAAEFLDQLALLTGLDAEVAASNEESELVTLSSVHQAKGLEWKIVFVISMVDGMFPSARSLEKNDAIEEERRLFYVAITRAKDELYLTFSHMRFAGGYGDSLQRPSRFLAEIPPELLEEWEVHGF